MRSVTELEKQCVVIAVGERRGGWKSLGNPGRAPWLGRLQINIGLRRRQVGDPGRKRLAASPIAMETGLRLPWQLGKPLGPAEAGPAPEPRDPAALWRRLTSGLGHAPL